MAKWVSIVVLFAVVACGSKKADDPTKAAEDDCKVAAKRMIADRAPLTIDEVDKLREAVETRCRQDAWSSEARACLVQAQTERDLERCRRKLTAEQTAKLQPSLAEKPSVAEAPSGIRISTKVLDATTEAPIPDALVLVLAPGVKASSIDVDRLDSQTLAWGRSNAQGEVQLKQPVPAPGTYTVMVVARGYESLIGEDELKLTAQTPPGFDPWGQIKLKRATTDALAITSIEPAKGDAEGGTYVLLKGQRFTSDGPRNAKVYFGSRQGTIVRFQSDTELIVQAPGGKAGEVVDVLLILDPGGQLALKNAFTFVAK